MYKNNGLLQYKSFKVPASHTFSINPPRTRAIHIPPRQILHLLNPGPEILKSPRKNLHFSIHNIPNPKPILHLVLRRHLESNHRAEPSKINKIFIAVQFNCPRFIISDNGL